MATLPFRTITKQWAATAATTVLSTYALDAAATAAGLLLVASSLLGGASHGQALVFLTASYITWGAGLRVSLRANRQLLARTGTSTNLFSKAAYDIAKLWSRNLRLTGIAADVGYVATEIAKEAPYYASAFAAAFFTDTVSAIEAIIFLGGANLGAAAYEYGLGRVVGTALRRRGQAAYASFESDWNPRDYLAEYYSAIEPDERQTIAFFAEAMTRCAPGEPILYFGTGPTLHHVFLAAERVSEIHLGDYVPANLHEIEGWIARHPSAYDWRQFVRYTLECEGSRLPAGADIADREELARRKISALLVVDVRRSDPLDAAGDGHYSTVVSAYCADSATSDRSEWADYMRRISGLVRPGGTLLTAALRRCEGYLVGGRMFPSANIDENDLCTVLEPYFGCGNVRIEVHELERCCAKGYSSIVLVEARCRNMVSPDVV